MPLEALCVQSDDMAAMFEWFDKVGYNADIAALRAEFTDVNWQTFAQWCDAQDWARLG